MSVERWLNDLHTGLAIYASFLNDLGFNSLEMLKFLKLKDLKKMPCTMPASHRRMILNAVLKLQTPILDFYGMDQLITQLTRVTNNSQSLIDLCLTNIYHRKQ